MATTQVDRGGLATLSSGRATLRLVVSRRPVPVEPRVARWVLVYDAAGGAVVLATWAALWTWFLAATW